MQHDILKYFRYEHLPPFLQAASKPFSDLANDVALRYNHNGETEAGLRKLLEAKDCFVRAALDQKMAVEKLQASMITKGKE